MTIESKTEELILQSYELMMIFPPNITEKEQNDRVAEIKTMITDKGGQITHEDFWGKREFTYPIKKHDEGYYVILNFNLSSDNINSLHKELRLNVGVLRFLITKTPEDYKMFVYEEDNYILAAESRELIKDKKEEPQKMKPYQSKKKEITETGDLSEKEDKEDKGEVVEKKSDLFKKDEEEQKGDKEDKKQKKDEEPKKEKEDRWKNLDEKLDKLLSSDDL